jgi:hypothetical protein
MSVPSWSISLRSLILHPRTGHYHLAPQDLKAVKAFDVVITMGCGDTCSYSHGNATRTGLRTTPAGQDLDHVGHIRDQIRQRVRNLIGSAGRHLP